jgi:Dual-action HEIGH metallo-peptidase
MLRKALSLSAITAMAVMFSCQQQEVAKNDQQIPADISAKLQKAGFDLSEGFAKKGDKYLVEYDILLSEEQINELAGESTMTLGEEHYRTTNLVAGNPRTISVFMDPAFDSYMQSSFNTALARYNALNLNLRFQRASSSSTANISIIAFFEQPSGGFITLGISAGFPSASGNPASPIKLNTYAYNASSQRPDAATVIAHEIGHAIGFRHTDYANRAFSCGANGAGNEGQAGVGAIRIPGTPRGGSSGSWMLACSGGTDRPFTSSDVTALTTVY